MRRTLWISLLLHALTAALMWWSPAKPRPPSRSEIAVEILEHRAPSPVRTAAGPRRKAQVSSPGSTLKPRGLTPDLLSGLKPEFARPSAGPGESSAEDPAWYAQHPDRDRTDTSWGQGGGTFARVRDYHLMSVLSEKIEGHLFYPGILARNHIQGTVNARLVLDAKGDCDFRQTRIYGTDPNLKIFVLHVMKAACAQNYRTYLGGRTLTVADLSFQFEITEHDDAEIKKGKQLIVGNSLLFYRNSQQSVAEWRLGPFRGVFPIPFVSVDLQWLQENWEKYIDNRDPMDRYRPGRPGDDDIKADGRLSG